MHTYQVPFRPTVAPDGTFQSNPPEYSFAPGYRVVKVLPAFKITVYDPAKPEDQRLYTGTINDIRDWKYNPTKFSRVMVRYRSRGERDIIVFNDWTLNPNDE